MSSLASRYVLPGGSRKWVSIAADGPATARQAKREHFIQGANAQAGGAFAPPAALRRQLRLISTVGTPGR
ncbi:MAG: hypothetical protein ACOYNY_20320 [Caldilineaceae bacterium]